MQFDHGHTHRDQVSRLSALGQDALRSGDLAGARQHFCDVVRIEPENGPAWRQLAAIAETPEERVALLEQVTRLEPSNDAALASLAEAKQELDLLRRARRQQEAPAPPAAPAGSPAPPDDAGDMPGDGAGYAPANGTRRRRRVLVAEANATMRRVLTSWLEKEGCVVASVDDGAQALAVLECDIPDLVLLDCAMPGVDGYQVCERIKTGEDTRRVPVVLISPPEGFDRARRKAAGADAHIVKPFNPDELTQILESLSTAHPAD